MKIVILFSGGLDSAVVAAMLKEKKHDIHGLFVDYGQLVSVTDYKAAKAIANCLKMPLMTLQVSEFKLIVESALLGNGESTEVPGRNLFLLSLAVAYAQTIGAKYVAYGANINDVQNYPDCSVEFIENLDKTIKTAYNVELLCPTSNMTKKQVVEEAKRLRIPIEQTHSCYFSERPCGKCIACKTRQEALKR